jgi:hypothetical protein
MMLLGVAAYFFRVSEHLFGFLTLMANLVINLLPIFLMRYNRI